MKAIEIYINEEAMERAQSKEEKNTEKYFWWFLWFIVGVIFGYALLWMQASGK